MIWLSLFVIVSLTANAVGYLFVKTLWSYWVSGFCTGTLIIYVLWTMEIGVLG